MGNLLLLGVPILKHITVDMEHIADSICKQVRLRSVYPFGHDTSVLAGDQEDLQTGMSLELLIDWV